MLRSIVRNLSQLPPSQKKFILKVLANQLPFDVLKRYIWWKTASAIKAQNLIKEMDRKAKNFFTREMDPTILDTKYIAPTIFQLAGRESFLGSLTEGYDVLKEAIATKPCLERYFLNAL